MFGLGYLVAVVSLLAALATDCVGVILGVPAAENPAVQKVAPAECLAYFSWSGMKTADGSADNVTEKMLADPQMQHALQKLEAYLAQQLPPGADWSRMIQTVLTHSASVYVSDFQMVEGEPRPLAGAIVDLGENAAALQAELETLQQNALGEAASVTMIGGQKFYTILAQPDAPPFVWGVVDTLLLAAVGEGEMERLLPRLSAQPPAWVAGIAERCPVERRATATYVDLARILAIWQAADPTAKESSKVLELLGLNSVRSLTFVTGLDTKGAISRCLLETSGEPAGVFKVLAGAKLGQADLNAIPADAPAALVLRVDPVQLFDQFVVLMSALNPEAHRDLARGREDFQETFGADMRDDLAASLGDSLAVYAAPDDGGLLTGWTAAVSLKDPKTIAPTFNRILEMAGSSREAYVSTFGKHRALSALPRHEPIGFTAGMSDDHLVFGLYPQSVRSALTRDERFEPFTLDATTAAEDHGALKGYLRLNTREIFGLVYPFLQGGSRYLSAFGLEQGMETQELLPVGSAIAPYLGDSVTTLRQRDDGWEFVSRQATPLISPTTGGPVAAAFAVSAVIGAQQGAAEAMSRNHLKQIGLGIHNYADQNLRLPPAANVDADGKPLLSWRVHLLPFLDEEKLYSEFHLDEPWDSEHNKTLLARMPDLYRAPGSKSPAGTTVYLGNRNDANGIFSMTAKVRFRDIVDGTSNTIAVVEVNDENATPWTKPADFEFSAEEDNLRRLLGQRPDGFLALFVDASVQMVGESIDNDDLGFLLNRQDGQVPNYSSLGPPPVFPFESRRVQFGRVTRSLGPGADDEAAPFEDRDLPIEAPRPLPREDEKFDKPAPPVDPAPALPMPPVPVPPTEKPNPFG